MRVPRVLIVPLVPSLVRTAWSPGRPVRAPLPARLQPATPLQVHEHRVWPVTTEYDRVARGGAALPRQSLRQTTVRCRLSTSSSSASSALRVSSLSGDAARSYRDISSSSRSVASSLGYSRILVGWDAVEYTREAEGIAGLVAQEDSKRSRQTRGRIICMATIPRGTLHGLRPAGLTDWRRSS